MRRVALLSVAGVLLLAAVSLATQVLLPSLAERRVADRLETGGGTAGVSLSGELGGRAGGLLGGSLPLVLDLRARVRSRDGQPEVDGTSGRVAGLPAGPLVQLALAAVLPRI